MSILQKGEKQTNGQKIGEYTRYQREKRKISLNKFGRHIGVDPSFLKRLEEGMYQGVSIDVIEKLAFGFDMSIESFLRKCKIASYPRALPSLEYFLRESYQFPDEAIEECQNFIAFLQMKYRSSIRALKKKHALYWNK